MALIASGLWSNQGGDRADEAAGLSAGQAGGRLSLPVHGPSTPPVAAPLSPSFTADSAPQEIRRFWDLMVIESGLQAISRRRGCHFDDTPFFYPC